MQHSKWIVLGFGALCLITVATVIPPAQHLYYMAAILISLPAISYAIGWAMLRGLTFQRELPSSAWEGEEIDIAYVVHNPSRFIRFFLSVHEELPPRLLPLEEEPLFNVPSQSTMRVARRVRCLRRGLYQTDSFQASAVDPLGVFAFLQRVSAQSELLVYPSPLSLTNPTDGGGEQFGLQQILTAFRQGSSVDLSGVRPFVPGDPLRRIHWRQTARTGQLNVVEFEEMQSVRLTVLLDARQGSEEGNELTNPFEFLIKLATTAIIDAVDAGAWTRLCVTNSQSPIGYVDTGGDRGALHRHHLLTELARAQANGILTPSQLLSLLHSSLSGSLLLLLTCQEDPTLPSILSSLKISHNLQPLVLGIDPATFPQSRAPSERLPQFLRELASGGAQTVLFNYHPDAKLVVKEQYNGLASPTNKR